LISIGIFSSFYCEDKVNKSEGDIDASLIASEFTRWLGTTCATVDTDDDILADMSRLSMMDETIGFKLTTGRSVRFNSGTKDW
jgi:hypothetical protein